METSTLFAAGLNPEVPPTRTFPYGSKSTRRTPSVLKATVFAAGKYMPLPVAAPPVGINLAASELPLTVKDPEVSVVMLADETLKLEITRLVRARFVTVAEVKVAVVPESVAILAEVPVSVVIVAEVDCN